MVQAFEVDASVANAVLAEHDWDVEKAADFLSRAMEASAPEDSVTGKYSQADTAQPAKTTDEGPKQVERRPIVETVCVPHNTASVRKDGGKPILGKSGSTSDAAGLRESASKKSVSDAFSKTASGQVRDGKWVPGRCGSRGRGVGGGAGSDGRGHNDLLPAG